VVSIFFVSSSLERDGRADQRQEYRAFRLAAFTLTSVTMGKSSASRGVSLFVKRRRAGDEMILRSPRFKTDSSTAINSRGTVKRFNPIIISGSQDLKLQCFIRLHCSEKVNLELPQSTKSVCGLPFFSFKKNEVLFTVIPFNDGCIFRLFFGGENAEHSCVREDC
jgi:hypothetical protein